MLSPSVSQRARSDHGGGDRREHVNNKTQASRFSWVCRLGVSRAVDRFASLPLFFFCGSQYGVHVKKRIPALMVHHQQQNLVHHHMVAKQKIVERHQ